LIRCLKFDDRYPLKESTINNWCGSGIWRSRRPYRKTLSNLGTAQFSSHVRILLFENRYTLCACTLF
jgi:hypothetical protein